MAKNFKSPHLLRVETTIQKIISRSLVKKVSDPRLKEAVITGVDMTSDFSMAKVYWSIHSRNSDYDQRVGNGFKSANGLFRHEIANNMHIYKIPKLTFKRDHSIEYGDHIENLIYKLNHGEN